jgi:hypothetical protein
MVDRRCRDSILAKPERQITTAEKSTLPFMLAFIVISGSLIWSPETIRVIRTLSASGA